MIRYFPSWYSKICSNKVKKSQKDADTVTFMWLTVYLTVFEPPYAVKPSDLSLTVSQNKMWKIICTHCLTQVCSPQTNRKLWGVKLGRSSCRRIAMSLQLNKVPEPQRCLALGNTRAGPPPHCLLCLPLYSSIETSNSLDAFPPSFIYPGPRELIQWKRIAGR